MNTLERISRHSRGYKAEGDTPRPVWLWLPLAREYRRELITHSPPSVSAIFNAAASIAQRTRSSDLMVHARGLSDGSCRPENYSSVSDRPRVIAGNESHEIAVCFLSSRSIYRPSDPFASFVEILDTISHSFFLSPSLSLFFPRRREI